MTIRLFPRPAPMPQIFRKVVLVWFGMPFPLAQIWWEALVSARWSVSAGLRQHILLWEGGMAVDGYHFIHQVLAPARLVTVIEALVEEKRLSREQASALEEALFAHISADGTWI